VGESVDGEYATVRTLIVARESPTVPVDYQLFRRGDQWLVYDILIEHVSLVDNYRSQFRDIIATSSYANLVKRIETKLAELRAQNPLLSLAPLSAQPRRAATSPQRYIVCRPTAGA
jgi:phospholipid transport system substrate-binding protein